MVSLILKGLNDRLLIKRTDGSGIALPVNILDNDSIRPTPPRDRTWTSLTYTVFWFSANGSVNTLYTASTGMTMGLSMWEAVLCMLGGQILAGALMALNGRGGAVYRIPFPVLCRASFGVWGAWWPTFNRAVMSIVWNGVNTVQGAQCLYVFLLALFPSLDRIPDTMGPKSALNSGGMICFAIYWLLNTAFLVIPVPRMKKLVYLKAPVFYIATLVMLAWVVSLAHGSNSKSIYTQGYGTFISNATDLQRYAQKPNDVLIGQFIGFPISICVVGILGNIIAASSMAIFGQLVWNPLTHLRMLMEGDRFTPQNRAGCAIISLAYVFCIIVSAIFENSIPAGNDIAALYPKYIDVKRGFFICAVLSYAICPWYLLASASVFINFLASYQIFLSAIAGVLICDYYLLRRGSLNIPALYSRANNSTYYFFHGFNMRAFAAYVIAVAPNFYGFLYQLGVKAPLGIQRFYYIAYPVGLAIGFGTYALGNIVFPLPDTQFSNKWKEPREYGDHSELSPSSRCVIDGVIVDKSGRDAEMANSIK